MADPTQPSTPITIKGKPYTIRFTNGVVADTEELLLARGVKVNLLMAKFGELTASSTRALFIAGLKADQPSLSLEEAKDLYDVANTDEVLAAIDKTYRNYQPEPREAVADPLQPGS